MMNVSEKGRLFAWLRVVALLLSCLAYADPGGASQAVCGMPSGASFAAGVLPDPKTAGLVALQILNGVYGSKLISHQLPLNIVSQGDRYVINGVRQSGAIGGHATIILCKSNAAVVFLSHSK